MTNAEMLEPSVAATAVADSQLLGHSSFGLCPAPLPPSGPRRSGFGFGLCIALPAWRRNYERVRRQVAWADHRGRGPRVTPAG